MVKSLCRLQATLFSLSEAIMRDFEMDNGGYFVFEEKRHELCKCLTKTPDYQHHKQYCPVWKNGRIADLELKYRNLDSAFCEITEQTDRRITELESAMSQFIEEFELTTFKFGECARVYKEKFKKLLSNDNSN